MNPPDADADRGPRFEGVARTRLGRWSVGLALAFLALLVLFQVYARAVRIPRPTFFSDPLNAALLLGAAGAAIGGGIVGALALMLKHERSFAVLLSVLVGGFVLLWTIAELVGH